jgi:hypothetical protein
VVLDKKKHILYFYPPSQLDLNNAVIEVVRLKHLVEMEIPWVSFTGLLFKPRME